MHKKNIKIDKQYPKEIPRPLAIIKPIIGPNAAPKSCHVEYLEIMEDFWFSGDISPNKASNEVSKETLKKNIRTKEIILK